MKTVKILVKRSPGTNDLPVPAYMTPGASGIDLCADVPGDVVLMPSEIKLIPTGISIAMPEGYEAQIRPRSGLALKHGITFVNTPGTIDSDYRGVISLIMTNLSKNPFTISRGMRIGQMVIQEVVKADFSLVDELPITLRQGGGFGHTGV